MDNTTVLSWNVRGLNAQARRDNVRTLVDDTTFDCLSPGNQTGCNFRIPNFLLAGYRFRGLCLLAGF